LAKLETFSLTLSSPFSTNSGLLPHHQEDLQSFSIPFTPSPFFFFFPLNTHNATAMSDNRGGRNGRRNDSVSSVMSLGADNTTPSWVDDSAPATQRPSRAEDTQLQALDHEASVNMISQYGSGHASYNDSSDLASSEQSDDTMSDTQLRHAIFEILDSMPDEDLLVFYQKAPMIPPVTQESLGELDVGRIINNPKLRHDVNFDRELHFRPNLDGTKGKNKLKSSHQFWEALLAELEVYRALGHRLIECQSAEDMEDLQRMIKANQLRLPGVFTTIQNVLKTLIPERDQIIVAERLDVDMIMQQICKGVFNILDLAEWLAGVLKAHCAPMRDEWIDRMVGEMTEGVERGDQRAVMTGLRETVSILEAMKLVSCFVSSHAEMPANKNRTWPTTKSETFALS
jgi:hypothetical protein